MERRHVGDEFALLVSSVIDYAIFMLDPSGHIVTWNEGAQRIKGYTASEITGRHFSIFYPAEQVRSGKPDWELDVARRDGRYAEEGWRLRKDGSRFWASVTITALRDETGRLRGFGKVTRDLTDRHLHEERMAELERTKGEFLNLASHELRGPLTVIRGYNSMLQDGSIPLSQVPQVTAIVEGKLAQMDLLIEQMLETAWLEYGDLPLHLEAFDLGAMAADRLDTFRPLGVGHDFVLSRPAVPVSVHADRLRAGTIIANLIDNAIKYSPRGGEIRCTVGTREGVAFVEVRDQGIGIAREHFDRLFTRFGRLPTAENAGIAGTGLGLFLCREIARRHGGDVTAQSEIGAGSAFTLTLPATAV